MRPMTGGAREGEIPEVPTLRCGLGAVWALEGGVEVAA